MKREVVTGSLATTSGTQDETPIVDKINILEKHILKGKLVLVDDHGKPLEKAEYQMNLGSDKEVEPVEIEMACFLALKLTEEEIELLMLCGVISNLVIFVPSLGKHRSKTPVRQGSTVIVTADAGFPLWTLVNPWIACRSDLPKSLSYPLYVIKSSQSSIVTTCGVVPRTSALDALCEKFHNPNVVHPELPSRNNRIRNNSAGKCQCPGAGNDDVNEEDDEAQAIDNEAQVINADKPKRIRKKRKAIGAGGSGLLPKKLKEDHGATVAATVPFVTSFVTPTLEREGGGLGDSVTGLNLSSMPHPPVLTVIVATTIIVDVTYAPAPRAGTGKDYEQLFVEFNVGTESQSCVGSEVRLQLEHELGEAEAAEAIHLCGQVAIVEAAELSCDELSIKAASLESDKDKLIDQVSQLEGTCFELRDEVMGYKLFNEQIEAVQDVQVKMLSDRVAELDANLIGMALHLDEEFYPHCFTTIAGQRGMQVGLAAGIDLGKAEMDLTDVAAYDLSAKANYMSDVSALRVVNFHLLAQLESHKDASIADLLGLLHLEGPAAETPEAILLYPYPEQLMLPIHRLEDQLVIGETSLSFFWM
nr:hypothetical protein [Tanacetum cinerariifolium]